MKENRKFKVTNTHTHRHCANGRKKICTLAILQNEREKVSCPQNVIERKSPRRVRQTMTTKNKSIEVQRYPYRKRSTTKKNKHGLRIHIRSSPSIFDHIIGFGTWLHVFRCVCVQCAYALYGIVAPAPEATTKKWTRKKHAWHDKEKIYRERAHKWFQSQQKKVAYKIVRFRHSLFLSNSDRIFAHEIDCIWAVFMTLFIISFVKFT